MGVIYETRIYNCLLILYLPGLALFYTGRGLAGHVRGYADDAVLPGRAVAGDKRGYFPVHFTQRPARSPVYHMERAGNGILAERDRHFGDIGVPFRTLDYTAGLIAGLGAGYDRRVCQQLRGPSF